MDFGQQLERYYTLKNELDNYTVNRHEKLSPDNELNNIRKYLFDIYMVTRLNAGLDKGNEFDFQTWVNNEIEQNNYIKNLMLEDDLDDLDEPAEQVQSFDNLGFNNNFLINWRENIFQELKNSGVVISDFYLSDLNKNNKDLLEHIVLMPDTFNHLNNKGLLNVGYCPITGEKIGISNSYNMYGRHIYLSKTGLEICKGVNKNDWKENDISYDEFERLKNKSREKSRKQASFVVITLIILSIFISWNIVSPTGFLSFLSFVLIGFVVFFILGWLFNFLWDFYRN
ncbi:hypothetical protein [Flavobacterium sp.]|uniref:hypothetical protein n=1 Tax=Flavobacterium sp. TaxID=239 RepID=UPI002BF84790|nr:hypothetical protein [Flavobacterium sp.]HSD08172.1 hypothetical protein [Flavobacterium sp.]